MGTQLPSGILLFFALALFLAAVFVLFSGGEGVSTPSAILGIALLLLAGTFVWLVGGEGGQEANRPETTRIAPESTAGTTAEETTSASGPTGQAQGGSTSYANYCIEKQFAEATQGLDPQQASDYETGVISEAVARGVDPRTILIERGFPC